jgi:hypothetical protein
MLTWFGIPLEAAFVVLSWDESMGKLCLNKHTSFLCETKLQSQIIAVRSLVFLSSCNVRAIQYTAARIIANTVAVLTIASCPHTP